METCSAPLHRLLFEWRSFWQGEEGLGLGLGLGVGSLFTWNSVRNWIVKRHQSLCQPGGAESNLGRTTPLRLSVMKMMKAHFGTCNALSKRQNIDGLKILPWWDSTWLHRKTNSVLGSPWPPSPPLKTKSPSHYFLPRTDRAASSARWLK